MSTNAFKLPTRDILKGEDPCEHGRNRPIFKGVANLKTFEEQDNEQERSYWIRPEDVADIFEDDFETKEIGLGVAKTKQEYEREKTEHILSSSTPEVIVQTKKVFRKRPKKNKISFVDLTCPKTLEYYFQRDQERIKNMIVIEPEQIAPLRILQKKKYKQGKPIKVRQCILVA
jgi:hypothetical protein